MIKKKVSLILILILIFSLTMIFLVSNVTKESGYMSVFIDRVIKKELLEQSQEVIIYTGMTESEYVTFEAKENHAFVLLEINISNYYKNKTINTKNFYLNIDGQEYQQIKQNEFINEFGYKALKKFIPYDENEKGYLIFEVSMEDVNKDYNLWNLRNDKQNSAIKFNNIKKESFIQESKNIIKKQNEIDKKILKAYEKQEYTVENPYVVVNPYGNAPLAALVLFKTSTEKQIKVKIEGEKNANIEYTISGYNKEHEIPIIGLYSNRNNKVELRVVDLEGNEKKYYINIKTDSISSIIDEKSIELVKRNKENVVNDVVVAMDSNRTVLDGNGDVRWLLTELDGSKIDASGIEEFLENGRILLSTHSYELFSKIYEVDWLGKVHWSYSMADTAHHDAEELPNGNILYSSSTHIYEVERYTNNIIRSVTFEEIFPVENTSLEIRGEQSDWFHINTIEFNETDNSLIVSSRNQHAVIKFTYPSFDVQWVLSPVKHQSLDNSDKYLTEKGDFEWFYSQHQPTILPDLDNDSDTVDLLLFDNGVHRSIDEKSAIQDEEMYSRFVHYRINEYDRTVTQVFDFGKQEGMRFYSDIQSGVQYLADSGNYFATFDSSSLADWSQIIQSINYDVKSHIVEVNETGEIIFQIDINNVYRSYKKPVDIFSKGYARLGDTGVYSIIPISQTQLDIKESNAEIECSIKEISIEDGYLNIKGYAFLKNDLALSSNLYLIMESQSSRYVYDLLKSHTQIIPEKFLFGMDKQVNLRGFDMQYIDLNTLPTGKYKLKVAVMNSQTNEVALHDTGYEHSVYKTLMEKQALIQQDIDNKFLENRPIIEKPIIIQDPYDISPLTAMILFKTAESSKVSINIKGKNGQKDIIHNFDTYNTNHQIPVYGLYPEFQNKVELTVENIKGEKNSQLLNITTDVLPYDFPDVSVQKVNAEKIEDGFIFMVGAISNSIYPMAIDEAGNVRWYLNDKTIGATGPIRKLLNGNFLISSNESFVPPYYVNGFFELNLLGKIEEHHEVQQFHHDVVELPNGDFIALANNPDQESSVEDYIVRIDRETNEVIKKWDMREILQIPLVADENYSEFGTHDWLHINSVDYVEKDNALIISSRHQDAVIKFDMDLNEIIWILSDPNDTWPEELKDKLLIPTNKDFVFNFGQHAVKQLDNGDIILFDNGNFKSKFSLSKIDPNNNYSRLLRLKIDDEKKQVTQLYEYGSIRGSELFSPYVGDVDVIGDNYLVTFGGIIKDNSNNSYESPADLLANDNTQIYGESVIIELSGEDVVLEMKIRNAKYGNIYRSEKMEIY